MVTVLDSSNIRMIRVFSKSGIQMVTVLGSSNIRMVSVFLNVTFGEEDRFDALTGSSVFAVEYSFPSKAAAAAES